MKRLIAAVVLCVFISGVAVIGNVTAEKYYNYNKTQIEKCVNGENATESVKNIKKAFNKYFDFLYIYGNRKTINSIKYKIDTLKTSVKYKNTNQIEIESKELLQLIESFCGEEQLKKENFY